MERDDLAPIGEMETRALIIGGGIAGLLAARVLSEFYDQVQIVERDILPENSRPRAGTPQSFHLHRVLGRGKAIMERLFPDLTSELLKHGAVSTPGKNIRIVNQSGQFNLRNKIEEATCSRALLEWTIRRRVLALPNVHIASGLEVIGLQMDSGQKSVTGVFIRKRGQIGQSSILRADLVVETSGRATRLTPWLTRAGYRVPEPERLKTALGYSTRYYRISDPQFEQDQSAIIVYSQPEKRIRAAYALQMEDNQWHVTLFGAGREYPATNDKGFDQQLRQLISPVLAETLQTWAEPITSPRGYRIAECLRQHFDQMERWPSGLLVMGDALCNLDPIYGHGMTVAALEADILARCLKEQQDHPRSEFELHTLKELQAAIEPAWWIDAIADLRWSGVIYSGQERPRGVALIHRYLDLYLQEATKRMEEMELSGSNHRSPSSGLFSPQPSFITYSLMIELTLSPRVVFNETTYRLLLEIEAAQEGASRLQELTEAYQLPLAEILDKVLPTFSLPFLSSRARQA